MTRRYAAITGPLSVSADGDLLTLYLNNNGYAEVERITLACVDTTLPTAQMIQLEAVLMTNATVASGGAAADIAKLDPGDADPGVAAESETGGTSGDEQIVFSGGCYAYQGLDHVFQEPVALNSVGDTTAFVFRVAESPVGTLTLAATVYFSERGLTGS